MGISWLVRRRIDFSSPQSLLTMAGTCTYSCETATQTLQWINAIVDFLRPYAFLMNAHVVNFFTVLNFPFSFSRQPKGESLPISYLILSESDYNDNDDVFRINYGKLLIRNGWTACGRNLLKIFSSFLLEWSRFALLNRNFAFYFNWILIMWLS